MKVADPWMITFLTIAIISMICTFGVILHLYQSGNFLDLKYWLLFLLHITVFLEDISTLPYIWSTVDGLCDLIGWMHFYSGFCNILVVTLMGFHYLSYLTSALNPHKVNKWISKYGTKFIFLFPLITLLPFVTGSYGVSNDDWCTLPSKDRMSNDWAVAIFYFWVWLCLAINIGQLSIAMYKLYQQKGMEEIRANVFSSIGLYIVITTICWLPRAIPRLVHVFVQFDSSDLLYLLTTLPLYLSGLGYTICYVIDANQHHRQASSIHSMEGSGLNAAKLSELLRGTSGRDSVVMNPPPSSSNPLHQHDPFSGTSPPVSESLGHRGGSGSNSNSSRISGLRQDSGTAEQL